MATEAELLCNSDQHDVSQAALPSARSPNLPHPPFISVLSFPSSSLLFTVPFTFFISALHSPLYFSDPSLTLPQTILLV